MYLTHLQSKGKVENLVRVSLLWHWESRESYKARPRTCGHWKRIEEWDIEIQETPKTQTLGFIGKKYWLLGWYLFCCAALFGFLITEVNQSGELQCCLTIGWNSRWVRKTFLKGLTVSKCFLDFGSQKRKRRCWIWKRKLCSAVEKKKLQLRLNLVSNMCFYQIVNAQVKILLEVKAYMYV